LAFFCACRHNFSCFALLKQEEIKCLCGTNFRGEDAIIAHIEKKECDPSRKYLHLGHQALKDLCIKAGINVVRDGRRSATFVVALMKQGVQLPQSDNSRELESTKESEIGDMGLSKQSRKRFDAELSISPHHD